LSKWMTATGGKRGDIGNGYRRQITIRTDNLFQNWLNRTYNSFGGREADNDGLVYEGVSGANDTHGLVGLETGGEHAGGSLGGSLKFLIGDSNLFVAVVEEKIHGCIGRLLGLKSKRFGDGKVEFCEIRHSVVFEVR
jgi:hypothetical protein